MPAGRSQRLFRTFFQLRCTLWWRAGYCEKEKGKARKDGIDAGELQDLFDSVGRGSNAYVTAAKPATLHDFEG
jgi:hypothetical protein